MLCVSHKVWARIWDKPFTLWPSFPQAVLGEVVGLLEHYMPTLQDSLDAWRWHILLLVKHVHREIDRFMYSVYIGVTVLMFPWPWLQSFGTLYFLWCEVCGGLVFFYFSVTGVATYETRDILFWFVVFVNNTPLCSEPWCVSRAWIQNLVLLPTPSS